MSVTPNMKTDSKNSAAKKVRDIRYAQAAQICGAVPARRHAPMPLMLRESTDYFSEFNGADDLYDNAIAPSTMSSSPLPASAALPAVMMPATPSEAAAYTPPDRATPDARDAHEAAQI